MCVTARADDLRARCGRINKKGRKTGKKKTWRRRGRRMETDGRERKTSLGDQHMKDVSEDRMRARKQTEET